MFYNNPLKVKKGKEEDFEFDMFAYTQNLTDDQTQLKVGQPRIVYNLISADGTLKSGYGFNVLSMPESETDVQFESQFPIRGNKVLTMWKLKYYDVNKEKDDYFLFYFNDEGNACFNNLFKERLVVKFYPTTFTATPYATYYRKGKMDGVLLSGEGGKLLLIDGAGYHPSENAPQIVSCCSHYDKFFAITAGDQGSLIYNEDTDILQWSDEKTKDLNFGDNRGNLNKIMSFNDYLYIFRDFGITRVSEYGKDELFEICHIYQSDAYIHPKTIAETGDKIYFLEGNRLKSFNGSSIKTIELDCMKLLDGCDNRYAYGECFEGKYYLACRGNYNDGQKIGCENEEGYKNNMLIVYDTLTGHADITRGIDINELLALSNKFKSKLIACFNGENVGKIGQLSSDGQFLEGQLNAVWESGKTDFGISGKTKRVKSFYIKSEGDCEITLTSERTKKTFTVKGNAGVQKVRANVLGNQFVVKIECKGENVYISNFVLTVGF